MILCIAVVQTLPSVWFALRCCQNKFDYLVFFTCKGSKISWACKNHLNHHLDHHPHGWQHFWGFLLHVLMRAKGVRHFVVFKNAIVMASNNVPRLGSTAATKRKRLHSSLMVSFSCCSATIFIENNHLGGFQKWNYGWTEIYVYLIKKKLQNLPGVLEWLELVFFLFFEMVLLLAPLELHFTRTTF